MSRFRILILVVIALQISSILSAQGIIINEVNQAGQWVELYNASATETIDVSTWTLHDFPDSDSISSTDDIRIISGNPVMGPQTYLVIEWTVISAVDGEVALYSFRDFPNPDALVDYMQYGNGHHRRAELATQKGVWDDPGAFVPNPSIAGSSLIMIDQFATGPQDTQSEDWSSASSSPGASNIGTATRPCPPLLVLNNNPVVSATYRAQEIYSTGRIMNNGNMETSFLAEDNISLDDPFQVDGGGILIANIVDCP